MYRSYCRVADHVIVTLGEKQGKQILFLRSIFKQQEILNSNHQKRHWMTLNLLNRDFRRVLFPVHFHYCEFYSNTAACVSSAQFSPLYLYNSTTEYCRQYYIKTAPIKTMTARSLQGCQVHPLLLRELIHSESQLHVFYVRQFVTFI